MVGLIIYFVSGLFSLFQAFLIKRNPDKVYVMQKAKDKQRGAEYEESMQMYYFFNYLVASIMCILTSLIGWLFGLALPYLTFAFGLVLGLMLILAKRHLTGEVYVWHWLLFAVGFILVVWSHLWLHNISNVEVQDEKLYMERIYKQEVYYKSIDSVLVVDKVPKTIFCTDGRSYLGSKKGEFRLKDGSNAKFYLMSKKAPFVELCTQNGSFFINLRTPDETEQLIEELKLRIGEKFVN